MKNMLTLALVLALAGCGSSAPEAREAPAQAAELEPEPMPEPAPEPGLTAEQREVLAPELERFGSGWALSRIEESYVVEATPIEGGYDLLFTARGSSGLFARQQIEVGGSFRGDDLQPPEAPELSAAQLAQADEALRASERRWLIDAYHRCTLLDLSGGLDALGARGELQTRFYRDRAVLVTPDERADTFVVVVDLDAGTVIEARPYSMPPNGATDQLSAEEAQLIDRALREHGDFSPYGDVRAGLEALVTESTVQIRRSEESFAINVMSSGGGHELMFSVDRSTGAIDGVMSAIPSDLDF